MTHIHRHVPVCHRNLGDPRTTEIDNLRNLQCLMIQSATECQKLGTRYSDLLKKYKRVRKKHRRLKVKYKTLYYSPDPGPGYLKACGRFEKKRKGK